MAADRAATLFMERNMTDKERLPRHVAVIMDGNGRWAQKNKVSRLAGHNAGMLAMKEIIKRADVLGIKYLTVYAFSTENWKRSQEEVGGIFGLLVKYVASELKELNENNVKVAVLGAVSYTHLLFITVSEDGLFLTGPTAIVAEGTVNVKELLK